VSCGLLTTIYGVASILRSIRRTVLVQSLNRTRRTVRPPLNPEQRTKEHKEHAPPKALSFFVEALFFASPVGAIIHQ